MDRALPGVVTTFQQHKEVRQPRVVVSAGQKNVDGDLLLEFFILTHTHEASLLGLINGMQGRTWSCTAHGFPYPHITEGSRAVFCVRKKASWLYVLRPRQVQVLCFVMAQKSGSIAQRYPPCLWSLG